MNIEYTTVTVEQVLHNGETVRATATRHGVDASTLLECMKGAMAGAGFAEKTVNEFLPDETQG